MSEVLSQDSKPAPIQSKSEVLALPEQQNPQETIQSEKSTLPVFQNASNDLPESDKQAYESPVVVRNLVLPNDPVFAIDDETSKEEEQAPVEVTEVQLDESNFEQKYEELLKMIGETAEEDGFINQKT